MIGMHFVTPSVTKRKSGCGEGARRGHALDVDDGLVVLERLRDRRAALGAEIVPIQAAAKGVARCYPLGMIGMLLPSR